ncbi:MAG: cadherin domain-containing protein [Bacteroidales bacterium]
MVQSFHLMVQVEDDGQGNLNDDAVITVYITDVNEIPEIENQSFAIDENTQSSVIVGTVQATDPDYGQSVAFAISAGNIDNAFEINSSNGQLTVNNDAALNFEVNSSFALTIVVTDDGTGNLSNNAVITVNLNDVNEVPEIDDQDFTIDENSSTGSLVGTVVAIDPDNGQSLTYYISDGNINNAFSINATNGEISVNNITAINFEENPSFDLTVNVTDNGIGALTDQATVIIYVNDLNEAPEVDEQSFVINENSSSGTQVGNVAASDPDIGQTLSFSIVSGNTANAFSLNINSGLITINNSSAMNFETNPIFNLVIQVDDNGTPGLSSQATISIHLDDVNEVPEIDDQSFSLVENSTIGSIVGTVLATDPDAGQSLTYTIESGNSGGAFNLNSSNGQITVNNPEMINFEDYPVFILVVSVEDNGTGNLSDFATIIISLQNINEAPVILTETFEVTIDGELLVPLINGNIIPVGFIQAIDPDAGQNLTYEISIGNHLGIWDLYAETGELEIINPYAFSPLEINTYSITVEVTDDALIPIRTTSEITIVVNILNLEAFIENNPYASSIPEASGMDFNVSVFPNPTTEFIKIESDRVIQEDLEIRIFNLNGDLILRKELNPTFTNISSRVDVSQLSNGTYVVNIVQGKVSKNVRLIKQ